MKLSSNPKSDSIESHRFAFLFAIIIKIRQFFHGYTVHSTPS